MKCGHCGEDTKLPAQFKFLVMRLMDESMQDKLHELTVARQELDVRLARFEEVARQIELSAKLIADRVGPVVARRVVGAVRRASRR